MSNLIRAEVVLDSLCYTRLTTLRITYPRSIHDQVLMYRSWSRTCKNTRGEPIEDMIQRVCESPYIPDRFPRNGQGMVPSSYLEGKEADDARHAWMTALNSALYSAHHLQYRGIHKELVNDLLSPFAMIETLVTSTEWRNFVKMSKESGAGQDAIRILAEKIETCLDDSEPSLLWDNQWHLPYISEDEKQSRTDDVRKLSYARCCTMDCTDEDVSRFDRFTNTQYPYLAPAEHIARPMVGTHSNFNGWISLRKFIEMNVDDNYPVKVRNCSEVRREPSETSS